MSVRPSSAKEGFNNLKKSESLNKDSGVMITGKKITLGCLSKEETFLRKTTQLSWKQSL